jgi:acylglycerol lipase
MKNTNDNSLKNLEKIISETQIQEENTLFESFDGAKLFVRKFFPQRNFNQDVQTQKISGFVLGLHGFGEHSGRYADVAKLVCSHNYAFVNFDARGHGKSLPIKGDAPNSHALVLDVLSVWNFALNSLSKYLSEDCFRGVLGHSFGSLMATYALPLFANNCEHVFLSSPCYEVSQKVPIWKKKLALTLPKIVPLVQVPVQINSEVLSLNPTNNSNYVADNMNMFSISVRYGEVFLSLVNEKLASHNAKKVPHDIVMAIGAFDSLCHPEAMKRVFEFFPSNQKKLHVLQNSGHEIFNEVCEQKLQALSVLNSWLERKKTHSF